MKDNQFSVKLENGTEQVCNFLFKFNDEDTKKNYIFFEIVISGICDVFEYVEDGNKEIDLKPVTDEKEREMLNDILLQYTQSEGCGCGGCSEEEHECCGGCK